MKSDEQAPGTYSGVKIPMEEVEGKVAFITGGTSGIGFGVARACVDAGMKVVITGLNEERMNEALTHFATMHQSSRVHGIRVNVTDRPGMEQAAAETIKVFGKVHVLINNAGVIIPAGLANTSYQDWDWVIGVNVTGVFNGVHAFLPRIQAHGEGGQIVTTSSVWGLFVVGMAGAYAVSKFALIGMMEALRAELAGTNIGVSVFCPGGVSSNLASSSRESHPGHPSGVGLSPGPAPASDAEVPSRDLQLVMDPFEAGRLLLQGIRNNDLYILTHPEFEPILRDRSEALMASIPRELRPTEARLALASTWSQNSIYATERDRTLLERPPRAG